MHPKRPLVVCITGPTATGKSALAVDLCLALDGEVLSMDSMQVYLGFTVGTAKPSVHEMGGVPHHLISFVSPEASYSVAEYQQDAKAAMDLVLRRGRLPMFVGGTGLYLHAISHPLSFTGAGHVPEIRKKLQTQAEAPDGPKVLHKQLAVVDPLSASRLHVNNTRRVIRALEVYLSTGRPMSEQANEWQEEPAEEWLIFALNWPRETLYARINERVDRMIAAGLVEEVRSLLHDGVPRTAQAMQAIGYKEIVSMLDGECTLEDAIATIKQNTRRYAKRQLTWLRRDERIRWINLSQYPNPVVLTNDITRQILAAQEGEPTHESF